MGDRREEVGPQALQLGERDARLAVRGPAVEVKRCAERRHDVPGGRRRPAGSARHEAPRSASVGASEAAREPTAAWRSAPRRGEPRLELRSAVAEGGDQIASGGATAGATAAAARRSGRRGAPDRDPACASIAARSTATIDRPSAGRSRDLDDGHPPPAERRRSRSRASATEIHPGARIAVASDHQGDVGCRSVESAARSLVSLGARCIGRVRGERRTRAPARIAAQPWLEASACLGGGGRAADAGPVARQGALCMITDLAAAPSVAAGARRPPASTPSAAAGKHAPGSPAQHAPRQHPGSDALAAALAQFDAAADHLALDPELRAILRVPQRELTVRFPVKLDDGSVEVFTGYRVQHNVARGPAKGGLRYHPQTDLDDVRALAMWMTWKCALVERPVRRRQGRRHLRSARDEREGGRGADPPLRDRARARHRPGLGHPGAGRRDQRPDDGLDHGHGVDAPGLLGAGRRHRQARRDRRLGRPRGRDRPGRRVHDRGRRPPDRPRRAPAPRSPSRASATSARRPPACSTRPAPGSSRSPTSAGASTTRRDSTCRTSRGASGAGTVAGAPGTEPIDNETLFGLDVDVLVLAALEGQITAANAGRVRARILAEGANGPTDPAADPILLENGVIVIPDILCNAGGVIVSYFEWAQNRAALAWTREEINDRLRRRSSRPRRPSGSAPRPTGSLPAWPPTPRGRAGRTATRLRGLYP